ncbi:ABC transporter permease [Psychrobacter lutiphocae]|uniref:ABC transporter permease n=1 Tax=Psychrobacter lutiphocae TaxID=540500 RepID=UPI000370CD59|nr:iron chelate uptake ABC transporter family permease subunit [Psychrobacter lutiphocae]
MVFRLSLLLLILCVVSLLVGANQITWSDFLNPSSNIWLTLTASRLPRLFTLILIGVGLSTSGVILQHIVRNKFVEPATSGGLDAAKLGILLTIILLPNATIITKMTFSLLFCFAASLFFIALVKQVRFKNTVLIPVLGLMYGSVLTAIAEFYAYKNNMLQNMQGWLLGDFSRIVQGHYELVYLIIPMVALIYLYAQRFTLMGMGEDIATSLGLNYIAMSLLGVLLVSVTVATSVITVGAIPFVGLVIPNLIALKYGENLSRTLPLVALGGACLLLISDIIGRLVIYPFEVPVGLTVSAIGGIIFLILIIRGIR